VLLSPPASVPLPKPSSHSNKIAPSSPTFSLLPLTSLPIESKSESKHGEEQIPEEADIVTKPSKKRKRSRNIRESEETKEVEKSSVATTPNKKRKSTSRDYELKLITKTLFDTIDEYSQELKEQGEDIAMLQYLKQETAKDLDELMKQVILNMELTTNVRRITRDQRRKRTQLLQLKKERHAVISKLDELETDYSNKVAEADQTDAIHHFLTKFDHVFTNLPNNSVPLDFNASQNLKSLLVSCIHWSRDANFLTNLKQKLIKCSTLLER